MEKIEIDMRVELVQMIDAGATPSEVEAHVSTIKSDLETARTVVVPEFPIVMAVIATMVATVIAVGRLTSLLRGKPSL